VENTLAGMNGWEDTHWMVVAVAVAVGVCARTVETKPREGTHYNLWRARDV